MKLISIKFNDDYILISTRSSGLEKGVVNSNLFQNSELIYSENYLSKNVFIITNIVNNICRQKCIDKVKFDDYYSAKVVIPIFIDNKYIKKLYYDFDESIKKDIFVNLIKCKNIKHIECLYMPDGFVRQLGKNNVSILFKQYNKFTQKFIDDNNLKSMNNMYYKRKVCVYKNTIYDFVKFLKINKSLKAVYLYDFSMDLLDQVLKLIGDKDVSVYIEQSENNSSIISENVKKLRKINKSFSNFNRDISIVYSKSYFKNNFFKQVNYNNLKLCSLVALYMGLILLLFNRYNDYKSYLKVQMLNQTLVDNIGTSNNMTEENVNDIIENGIEVNEPKEEKERYSELPQTFIELGKINYETVGWLTVNNTKINYPVVQHNDNSYYLNHDIYKSRSSNGWIFMDYRNDSRNFDQNTIIYGHSLLSKLLFGTLHNVISPSWYKNKNNQIITFKTEQSEYKFQIFSIYKIDETSDYLKTKFDVENEFIDFINMLKDRSVYNFNVDFTNDDKIITLSTCTGSNKENKRLVVHAKLLSN